MEMHNPLALCRLAVKRWRGQHWQRSGTMNCRARISSLVVFLLFSAILSSGQYGASLQGTVTDKSGAVVSGATVDVTNQDTGVAHRALTTGSGFYRISGLPPGLY